MKETNSSNLIAPVNLVLEHITYSFLNVSVTLPNLCIRPMHENTGFLKSG